MPLAHFVIALHQTFNDVTLQVDKFVAAIHMQEAQKSKKKNVGIE